MADHRDDRERLSSDELIRRARAGEESHTAPPVAPQIDETAGDRRLTKEAPDGSLPATDRSYRQDPGPPSVSTTALDTPVPSAVDTDDALSTDWPEIPGSSDPAAPPPGSIAGIWTVARWIIGAVLILWFLGRFFVGGTSLDALDIGDCFDDPGDIAEVSTVDTVNCNEPHDLKLYSTVTMGSDERVFPGVDQLFGELEEACVARFDAYVGADYWTSVYDIVLFTPLRDGWSDGDRTGMCALYEFDSTLQPIQTIGTARNSGR